MNNIMCCPNCGHDVEETGTVMLLCWNCGMTFNVHEEYADYGYDYEEDYDRQ